MCLSAMALTVRGSPGWWPKFIGIDMKAVRMTGTSAAHTTQKY
jgi:hypothetical protein